MNLPEPIQTNITDESFAGVTYHIRGALVPELQLELQGQDIMFEHHTLLWKESQTKIELRKLPGGVKRKIAGLEFFVTRTSGSGRIAFTQSPKDGMKPKSSRTCCSPTHLVGMTRPVASVIVEPNIVPAMKTPSA